MPKRISTTQINYIARVQYKTDIAWANMLLHGRNFTPLKLSNLKRKIKKNIFLTNYVSPSVCLPLR